MAGAQLDRTSLLLRSYPFDDLSRAELEPLAREAAVRHAVRGEYVHHVGDPAEEIYVVASGQLKDEVVTEDGDEVVHSLYGPGMVIGEPGFFALERNRGGGPRAVHVARAPPRATDAVPVPAPAGPRAHARRAKLDRAQPDGTDRRPRAAIPARSPGASAAGARRDERARSRRRGRTPKISQATLAAMVGVSRENVNRAQASVEPLRALRPAADVVGPIPYTALQGMLDEGALHGRRSYVRSGYVS